jgi:phospho-N-acetylmuramoyl-pentapeptide-transferase
MTKAIILLFIISFVISLILGPIIIPVLRKIKAGQTEREDGPESHLKKTGTPTMGGFIFLISAILSFFVAPLIYSIVYNTPLAIVTASINPEFLARSLPVIFLTLGFALIGFIDDFIKVVLKRSLGLRAWQKMLLQIIVAGAFALYLYNWGFPFATLIPFTGNGVFFNKLWFVPVIIFIIVGTVNGSNFTDGVDGLETSVTATMCLFLAIVAGVSKSMLIVVPVVFFGALLGFLMFNVNKALVFMGDTGSLALGGLVSGLSIMLGLEFYLPIFALIYFVEVLSVMLQVGYFKLTHGKRIFRMAPIHHHFELGGWTEAKVVAVFTAVTMVLCAFVLYFIIV